MGKEPKEPKVIVVSGGDQPVAPVGDVPVLWVDGVQGFMRSEYVVKFNLFGLHQDLEDPETVQKVFNARLVMDPRTAKSIALWILERLENQRVPKAPEDGGE